jgi:hypothetical protein
MFIDFLRAGLRKRRVEMIQVRDATPANDCANPERGLSESPPERGLSESLPPLLASSKIVTIHLHIHSGSLLWNSRRKRTRTGKAIKRRLFFGSHAIGWFI